MKYIILGTEKIDMILQKEIIMNAYQLPEALILRAIELKRNGKTWPEIEAIFTQEGYRTKTGIPFHNGNIAKQVLEDPKGAFLRQRVYSKKKKPSKKIKKSKVPKNQSVSAQIKYMKSLGMSPSKIIAVLETYHDLKMIF